MIHPSLMSLILTPKQHDALSHFFKRTLLNFNQQLRNYSRSDHRIHDRAYLAFFQGIMHNIRCTLELASSKPLDEMIEELNLHVFNAKPANKEKFDVACRLMEQLLTPTCGFLFYPDLKLAHAKLLQELTSSDANSPLKAFHQLEIQIEAQPQTASNFFG
jgi:hypothetical protein